MNMNLARVLALTGALPFLAGLAVLLVAPADPRWSLSAQRVLSTYALVILGFMAGVHWGQQLSEKPKGWHLMITSNLVALLGWFTYLFAPVPVTLASCAILFWVLLVVDYRLFLSGDIIRAYFRLRVFVTIIVSATLFAAALSV